MELQDLQTFIALIQTQSTTEVELSLTKLELLITVAIHPRMTGAEYAKLTGLPESSLNRHLRELREGRTGRGQKAGLGLIEGITDGLDWRKTLIQPSRKGKLLLQQLMMTGCPAGRKSNNGY